MFKTLILASVITSTINQTNLAKLETKHELNINTNSSVTRQTTEESTDTQDKEAITLFKTIESDDIKQHQPKNEHLHKNKLMELEEINPYFVDFSNVDIETLNREIEMEEKQSEIIDSVISEGVSQTGKPYVWGAKGINSFDCSMLMKHSMESIGIDFPRTSREQRKLMDYIEYEELKRGDFIFWHEGSIDDYQNVRHVAIYLGNEKMLHATPPRVTISKVAVNKSGKYNISYGRYNYIENTSIPSEI